MWHLYWRAEASRRPRTGEPARASRSDGGTRDTRPARSRSTSARAAFQHVWPDTPAGTLAADVPECVRVRGR